MVKFDSIVLPDLWFDPDMASGNTVDGRMVESRAGTPMIRERAATYRVADLIGAEDMGWMTHATLIAMNALIIAGAQYVLDYNATIYTARYRTWDAPVISAVPLVPRPNPAAGDEYKNVRIKLILL